ncbi:uncharacterized protein PG986_004336 [Apiospora aurea]|uniref:Uncharacterized protein n=1 Tax=Apiospora aurea TaxID=335848 RepID=A0ABR1QMB1_9PEZI
MHVVLQTPYRNVLVWLNLAGMAYYLVYIIYLAYTSAARMGLIRVSGGPTKHILMFDCFTVSRESCTVGLARVVAWVLSVTLYLVVLNQGPQQPDTNLERGVAFAITAAVLLGRIWPLKARQIGSEKSPKVLDAGAGDRTEEGRGVTSGHSSDTLIDSSDSEDEKNMAVVGGPVTGTRAVGASPGQSYAPRWSWLQITLELAVSILVLSCWGLPTQFDSKLGASVMLAVLLAEAIAPLGRHHVSAPSTSGGIARMHAGFSVVLYGALATLTAYGITDILQAAVSSVALHGAIQVLLDYQALNLLTKGAPRWSLCMQVFAAIRSSLAQTSLALLCLAVMEWEHGYLSAYLTTFPALMACLSPYGVVVALAVQPMVYSSVIGLYIVGHYIIGLALQKFSHGVVPLEDRIAMDRNPLEHALDSILHWEVAVCLVGVLLIPIVGSIRPAATAQTEPICPPKSTAATEDQLDQKQAEKGGELPESIHDKVL